MSPSRKQVAAFWLGALLLGCGGSLSKPVGPDGGTAIPCAAMGACECLAAGDRCAARTEACWCPSECDPQVACVCGGGQFVACDDKARVGICSDWLTAVQSKCAGQAFVQYIGGLCTDGAGDPFCIAGCLANLKNTGSCSEIDCSFCPVCDCGGLAPQSPFVACLQACRTPQPERL